MRAVKNPVLPEDEWLRDNFHLLEREGISAFNRLSQKKICIDDVYEICASVCNDGENIFTAFEKSGSLFQTCQLDLVPDILRSLFIGVAVQKSERTADAITGIRSLFDIEQEKLIQKFSSVEKVFLRDPAGIYEKSDDETRAYYRAQCAKKASRCKMSEEEYAKKILDTAITQDVHIGFIFLKDTHDQKKLKTRGKIFILTRALFPLVPALATGLVLGNVYLFLLLYIPFHEIFRHIIEYGFSIGLIPYFFPKLSKEEAKKHKILVTVSGLVPSPDKAQGVCSHLEKLFYANKSENIKICLLADLREAKLPFEQGDTAAINTLKREVKKLNDRHGEKFILLIRSRSFIKTQNAYAGKERKRGAITELIRLVKTGENTFAHGQGELSWLEGVEFVYALDADTQLGLDCALELTAAAAHPLNRPVISDGAVKSGFGILAPMVSTDVKSASQSLFSRLFAGPGGISPYNAPSGNHYQDMFGRGIFSGKGLIDTEAFYTLLDDTLPREKILSHDVLEGGYLRAGYCSFCEITDGCPYAADGWIKRQTRWIRGDFQNIMWLFPNVRHAHGRVENPLEGIARVFLADNIIRHLLPVFSALLLILSVFVQECYGLFFIALLSLTFGEIFNALRSVVSGGVSVLTRRYHSRCLPDALYSIARAILNYSMLFINALSSLCAALQGIFRQLSGKNLLQWTTAADTERLSNGSLLSYLSLCAADVCAGVIFIAFFPLAFKISGVLFLFCPVFLWAAGKKYKPEGVSLSARERRFLIDNAADMWRYYSDNCNAENNYLPPDNISFSPVYSLAARTSPTNIGMMLLSCLCARDMGFIDSSFLASLLSKCFESLEKLERFHGHFLNWYDTRTLRPLTPKYCSTVDSGNMVCCLYALVNGLEKYRGCDARFEKIISQAKKYYTEADFSFLYNPQRNLFHIGYDFAKQQLSDSYYDLFISEARMTSYFAVATRQVPKKHWAALSRVLSKQGRYTGPVSWSGTAFEYLMPPLLLPTGENTLAYEAAKFCVYCGMRKAKKNDMPFGCSESGFYAFDSAYNYQYKAHGIQRLGLKRSLKSEYVVSPYSSFLAFPFAQKEVQLNFSRLDKMGMYGKYGFYEAVDFTPARISHAPFAIVHSYMAHHIGMSICAIENALYDNALQKLFLMGETGCAAQLLEEKIPSNAPVYDHFVEKNIPEKQGRASGVSEHYEKISLLSPRGHLLKNGEMTLCVFDSGASRLIYRRAEVYRTGEDYIRDAKGVAVYVTHARKRFSLTKSYGGNHPNTRCEFCSRFAAFYAKTDEVECGMSVSLDKKFPCEIRTIKIKNLTAHKTCVRLNIILEPCLSSKRDYLSHPAFSRLFIENGYDKQNKILWFSKRCRTPDETPCAMGFGFAGEEGFEFETCFEKITNRARAHTHTNAAYTQNESGAPYPAAAVKLTLNLKPHAQKTVTFFIAAGEDSQSVIQSICACRRRDFSPHNGAKSPLCQGSLEARLAREIIPAVNFKTGYIQNTDKKGVGISSLWSAGISGDIPIVVLRLTRAAELTNVASCLSLFKILHEGFVSFDLCIVYREGGEYLKETTETLKEKIEALSLSHLFGKGGGIHLIDTLSCTKDMKNTIINAACCIINNGLSKGGFTRFSRVEILPSTPNEKSVKTEFKTCRGDFLKDEFCVRGEPQLPFCNVLCNESFGTLLSDRALGFTYYKNSREYRVTPFKNDTACDNDGEILFVKINDKIYDLVNGSRACFSKNRTVYSGVTQDVFHTVTVEVPTGEAYKKISVSLCSDAETQVSLLYYCEPVMGFDREKCAVIDYELVNGALTFKNLLSANGSFAAALNCDRNFTPLNDRAGIFSGRWDTVRVSRDGCAALKTELSLSRGEQQTVCFSLACAENAFEAAKLSCDAFEKKPQENKNRNSFEISTPDKSLDLLFNTWLPIQFENFRFNARCGFYQCSGAYGFRDQLQDVCALMYLDPIRAKKHILLCCTAQFEQGDVLHWWHENGNKKSGVRTRCSDDMLWLPLSVCEYIEKTNDFSILNEQAPFLSADELSEEENERYFTPEISQNCADVFEHCLRAVNRVKFGENALPLIGSCDWNDGFSRVGNKGRGTSVWLAQFYIYVAGRFAALCLHRGETDTAARLLSKCEELKTLLDDFCFENGRYLRAFFDDGHPIGSVRSQEAKIDLLTQAFAAIARLPDKERVNEALDTALCELVNEKSKVIRLLSPPFEQLDAGYISKYPKGVRENGGQYTHAAVWLAKALFVSKRADQGYKILSLINPAKRCRDEKMAEKYALEPYLLPADIYYGGQLTGRGGWSGYTGAAGWYWRVILEDMLGMKISNGIISFSPCLPSDWPGFTIKIDYSGIRRTIYVKNPDYQCDNDENIRSTDSTENSSFRDNKKGNNSP